MPEKPIFKYVTAFAGTKPAIDLSGRTLLFTHVPKTAGTTLDYILHAAALTQRIPFLRAKGSIYGQFHGVGKHDPLREFTRIPASMLERPYYLTGHLPYGIHKRLQRPYFYVTMLRDPLPRLLSQYRFGVQRGGWYESLPIAEVFAKGLMADNLQTRQLAGHTDRSSPVTAETLKTAIENLRSEYTVVGVSERFDDTLKLLITLLGWPDIAYGNRQVTPGAPSEQLMQRAQEATKQFFPYDLELYAVARELAGQNLAKLLRGNPQVPQRRNQVLACVPGTAEEGTEKALMSAQRFDEVFRPGLLAQGGEIQVV